MSKAELHNCGHTTFKMTKFMDSPTQSVGWPKILKPLENMNDTSRIALFQCRNYFGSNIVFLI